MLGRYTRPGAAPPQTVRAWHRTAAAGFDFELFDSRHFYLDEHGPRIIRALLGRLITAPDATREFA